MRDGEGRGDAPRWGLEPGALGQTMLEAAAERDGRAFGRCRMPVMADASASGSWAFPAGHGQPGSVVTTDGCVRRHTQRPRSERSLRPTGTGVASRCSLGRIAESAMATRRPPKAARGVPGRVHLPLQPQRRRARGRLCHRLRSQAAAGGWPIPAWAAGDRRRQLTRVRSQPAWPSPGVRPGPATALGDHDGRRTERDDQFSVIPAPRRLDTGPRSHCTKDGAPYPGKCR